MFRATPFALSLLVCLMALTTLAQEDNDFQHMIDKWVAEDALNPPPDGAILVIGDSAIRFWESLTRDFTDYPIIQRGFGGAKFSDLIASIDEIVLPYNPAVIVTDVGLNDYRHADATATDIFNGYVDFVTQVHAGQDQARPPIPILHTGLMATIGHANVWDSVVSPANSLIADYAAADDSLYYLDVAQPMLATAEGPGQPPSSDLFIIDGVHLTAAGYDIWEDVVRSGLESLEPPTKTPVANPLHPGVGSRILLDFGPLENGEARHTASPDVNGNTWNNWHPVGAIIDPGGGNANVDPRILNGESLGNLLTTTGSETGIDLIVTGEFLPAGVTLGGLLGPDPALLGDLALATATEDYFWGVGIGYWQGLQLGGFMLTGLDPTLAYDLRFFGSRAESHSWSTDYVVYGEGDPTTVSLQTSGTNIGSDGVYDGNDNQIAVAQAVRSDQFGQIFIDVTAAGSDPTYLNAMEIVVKLPGDFDDDGHVDGADFLLWQRGESPHPLSVSDLADWQTNYGFDSTMLSSTGAVPEPATLLLCGLCCVAAALLWCHSRGRRAYILAVLLVAALFCSPTTTQAATVFFDDFEDGDHLDGSPVTWGLTGPDVDDEEIVVDGSLVITSGGINKGYNLAGVDIELEDVSIRTQARAGAPDDVLAAGVRAPGIFGGYYVRVGPRDDATSNVLGLAGLEGGERVLIPTDLRPYEEDVVMQIDAIGDQISVWAWRPGEEMPGAPLITVTDDTITSGGVGVSVWNWPFVELPVEARFRYVHVADVHIHPGDFDNNGQVDSDDLLTWQQGYGLQSGAAPADGDADYDGDVDGRDFLMWQREYRTVTPLSASPTKVPEPSTLLLCVLSCGVVLFLAVHFRQKQSWLLLAGFVAVVFLSSAAQADIYQWEYVDPLDPLQGKRQSTTLTLGGSGLVPRVSLNALDKDLTKAYLPDFDLTDADFGGSILTDAYLSGDILSNASFREALLSGADLSGANLTDTLFIRATLTDTDLTNAEVCGADFDIAIGLKAEQLYSTASYQAGDLTGVQFGYLDVTGWVFADANLSHGSFLSATVTDADFTNAIVRGTVFSDAIGLKAEQLYSTSSYQVGDLTSLGLYGLDLAGWNFAGKNLTGGTFESTRLTSADLSNANLSGANLIGATLTDADLAYAVVRGANFRGATGLTATQFYSTSTYKSDDLAGIGLARTDLTGWDFAGRDLSGADFGGATLTGTNLRGTNLSGAQFRATSSPWESAELSGVDFTDARVTGAGFSGASMTAAQLYSTASYQAGDLSGIDLSTNDLAGWNFAGQNLTNANLEAISLAGADFTSAWIGGATLGEFTLPQLYSTASYQARDLAGIHSFELDLTGVDLSLQNLTGADLTHATLTGANLSGANLTGARLVGTKLTGVDFSGAEIRGADLWVGGPGTGVTAEQIYSTASYQARDLTGVSLQGNHVTDWDLTNLEIRGANFEWTDITLTQLYSTASYQAGDLTGVHFGRNDLTGIDLSGMTLTSADFGSTGLSSANLSGANLKGAAFPGAALVHANMSGANLTGTYYWTILSGAGTDLSGADLTGADARGATDMYTTLTETRNFIGPDGHVKGLQINAGETMRLWDFDLSSVETWWGAAYGDVQIDILVEDFLTIDSAATLRAVFEDEEWRSTITFEPNVPVSLAGTLEILFDDEVNPRGLVGTTYQLFDWAGVTPVGQFDWILTQNGLLWNTTSLYTTGEVTLVGAIPEPSTLLLSSLCCGAVVLLSNRFRLKKSATST